MPDMWDMVVEVKMHYDIYVGHGRGGKDAPSVKTANNRGDMPGDTQSCVGLSRCLFVATSARKILHITQMYVIHYV